MISPGTAIRRLLAGAAALTCAAALPAQEPTISAKDLAARLSDAVLDGTSVVRLKLETRPAPGAAKSVFQIQAKARRTKASSEIVYTVLWPKERKGESFLLRKPAGRPATGFVFTPPDTLRPLTAAQMQDGIFGSDLSYEDVIDNFFAWDRHEIVGTETVNRVTSQILESKPGGGQRSTYGRIRSWIDPKRVVPLRIEKFLGSGALVRTIEITRVAKDDLDRPVPASLSVRRAGQASVTEIEGSNSRHDVRLADADFTPEALRAAAAR